MWASCGSAFGGGTVAARASKANEKTVSKLHTIKRFMAIALK
jgi:hypothetical protein